jgi:pseudaminic acid synthase
MAQPHDVMIGDRRIGVGEKAYIIAEMSANHNQDIENALSILRAAKDAGADAVKIQTYTADTLTIASAQPWFRIEGGPWAGRTLHDLYGDAYTPWDWQPRIQRAAQDLGLQFFSTPFDDSSVAFLETLDVPVYKIASFENVDQGLLATVARTGKPVIMSTGMASLAEIDEAVATLRANGCTELILLKCVSAYPAPGEDMNLRTIPDLSYRFGVIAGLSDHSLDLAVPITAVALGARVIEKHLCLARSAGGPDSAFSLEPREFAEMVRSVRLAEAAMGGTSYGPCSADERKNLQFRRSLFVVEDVRAGEPFTAANVRSIRPGNGMHTRHLPEVLGRRAARDVARGTPLSRELVDKS